MPRAFRIRSETVKLRGNSIGRACRRPSESVKLRGNSTGIRWRGNDDIIRQSKRRRGPCVVTCNKSKFMQATCQQPHLAAQLFFFYRPTCAVLAAPKQTTSGTVVCSSSSSAGARKPSVKYFPLRTSPPQEARLPLQHPTNSKPYQALQTLQTLPTLKPLQAQ